MVSQWMENGHMLQYVTKYPGADRLELVGLGHRRFGLPLTGSQLVGITSGLDYLHNSDVVHGDLKGVRCIYPATPRLTYRLPQENILIDAEGSPRLSDFGLCSITKNINSVNASTPNHGCTVRYCAPELLSGETAAGGEKRKPTNKSDVYSLSMVIVEARLSESVTRPGSDWVSL